MIMKLKDSKIYRLSNAFYNHYNVHSFLELLTNTERGYNIAILHVEGVKGIVCLPFRSNMHHKNGYRFTNTVRSITHQSGIDFTKLVIINDINYIGAEKTIDEDEYMEFIIHKDVIHQRAAIYINRYRELVLNNLTESREFTRKYKYSTLKYFHEFLDL